MTSWINTLCSGRYMQVIKSLGHHLSGPQSAITCSKLTIETLDQRCEICSKLICTGYVRIDWTVLPIFPIRFCFQVYEELEKSK